MNDMIQASFDYSVVDQESADRLKEIKQEIRAVEDSAGLQIGMRLAEAQKLFNRRGRLNGDGGFLEWIEKEVRYKKQTVYDLINVYTKHSVNDDFQSIGNHFTQTVLVRLAAPSTPDSVIEKAREVAESGGTLTVAQVEEMKRKAKEEARAEMEAEKSALQSKLDLIEQRSEDWKEQAKAEKKKREEAETAARLKAEELKTLNQSVEQAAKRMAAAQLAEIKAALDNANLDKIEAEQKIKALKKDMAAAVETQTKQALQAQQDEINRREAQLQAIENRITTQQDRLRAIEARDQVVRHFESVTKDIKSSMDALSLHLTHAFDADFADHLPAHFVPVFEKLAAELESGARSVRQVLGQVEVRHLEVVVNG